MTKSRVTASSQLLLACGAFGLGLCMLFFPQWFYRVFSYVLKTGFLLLGVYELSLVFLQKNQRITHGFWFIVYAALFALARFYPLPFLAALPYILGFLGVVNGITRLLINYQYRQDGVSGSIWHLITGCILIIGAITFFIRPIAHALVSARLLGIYFILLSTNLFSDFFILIIPKNEGYTTRRRRIVLPVLIAAFLPQKVLSVIQKLSRSGELELQPAHGTSTDLEVFIHLLEGGLSGFGHVDLCFDGNVYSYGCYDEQSHRLFGMMSDGTLAVVPKEPYLKHCLEYEKKILVGFGISLSPQNREAVRAKIEEILENTVPWKCAAERGSAECKDAASALYRATGAHFYKFRSGAFKTYFVLNTNCVLLADRIIGVSGVDLLALNGITTPGTYFAFLNDAYQRKGSLVISRQIYGTEELPKKLETK